MVNLKAVEIIKNVIAELKLLTKDILDISKFNPYPTVSITFGIRYFTANFSYQNWVDNAFVDLSDNIRDYNLKSNLGVNNNN